MTSDRIDGNGNRKEAISNKINTKSVYFPNKNRRVSSLSIKYNIEICKIKQQKS